MKNSISQKKKDSVESLSKRLDDVKKNWIIQSKSMIFFLNQGNTAEFWDTVKRLHLQNMCINEVENGKKGIENIFKSSIKQQNNILKYLRKRCSSLQESNRIPSRQYDERNYLWHTIVKNLKPQTRERLLKQKEKGIELNNQIFGPN